MYIYIIVYSFVGMVLYARIKILKLWISYISDHRTTCVKWMDIVWYELIFDVCYLGFYVGGSFLSSVGVQSGPMVCAF